MILTDKQKNDLLKGYSLLLSFCGSFILNEPRENFINDLAESNIFRNLPVKSDNPSFLIASSYLNNINSEKRVDFNDILSDHLRLFGGAGSSLAPPYESVYLSPDHLMLQKQSIEVRNIYVTYGWRSSLSGKIPDDHLGIELQFLILLLEKMGETDDKICRLELEKDIAGFISDHLITWIPEWNRDVQKNGASEFYRGIGYMVTASLDDIMEVMHSQGCRNSPL